MYRSQEDAAQYQKKWHRLAQYTYKDIYPLYLHLSSPTTPAQEKYNLVRLHLGSGIHNSSLLSLSLRDIPQG